MTHETIKNILLQTTALALKHFADTVGLFPGLSSKKMYNLEC